jgi:hypothetical protein
METFLHAIVLLVGALVVIVCLADVELLARWSRWQRPEAFAREGLRGLFRR